MAFVLKGNDLPESVPQETLNSISHLVAHVSNKTKNERKKKEDERNRKEQQIKKGKEKKLKVHFPYLMFNRNLPSLQILYK